MNQPTSPALAYASMGILLLQNVSNILLIKYSRKHGGSSYIPSTAVFLSEVVKLCACFFIEHFISKKARSRSYFNLYQTFNSIWMEIMNDTDTCMKLAIPAAMYAIQNNLLYHAITNLDTVTFQITYQLKILTTALFAKYILNKPISSLKWLSLFLLILGIFSVQIKSLAPDTKKNVQEISFSDKFSGMVALIVAAVSSGYAGVYFEKIVKSSPESSRSQSLWIRNIQLSCSGLIFSALAMMYNDGTKISEMGFFHEYNTLTWCVILMQSFGGLLVAVVVKYADNVLKGFVSSIALIINAFISVFVFKEASFSFELLLGSLLVIISSYLYNIPDNSGRLKKSYAFRSRVISKEGTGKCEKNVALEYV